MANEEVVAVEEVEETPEKPKKGLNIMLIIVGLVAILQCAVLVVIFKDEIGAFFEGMKPEPVEVVLYHEVPDLSVNLADKDKRHFLKASITIKYNSEEIATELLTRVPELESKVIEVLRSKKFEEVDSVEDTEKLGLEIVAALNELFETDSFQSVHFTDILYQ